MTTEAKGEPAAIPELPHGCGSWVCTAPDGERREVFYQRNAELAAALGWRVETAIDYLHRINNEIATGAKTP